MPNIFIKWDKGYITEMKWAKLNSGGKSLLPVIYSFRFKNRCELSQRKMALYTGRNEKAIRDGIKNLVDNRIILKIQKLQTKEWSRNIYTIFIELCWHNNEFFLFDCKIIPDKWKKLKPTAQALFPVLLCFSEKDEIEENNMICRSKKIVLSKYAGIDRRSIKSAFENLEQEGLIKQLKNRPAWKIM
jgi:hypothetical protein